jgi:hypothetical protein
MQAAHGGAMDTVGLDGSDDGKSSVAGVGAPGTPPAFSDT